MGHNWDIFGTWSKKTTKKNFGTFLIPCGEHVMLHLESFEPYFILGFFGVPLGLFGPVQNYFWYVVGEVPLIALAKTPFGVFSWDGP